MYRDIPDGGPPLPQQKKRNIVDYLIIVGFAIFFALGLVSAILNFMYARDATKMATTIAFIHADIIAMLICLLFIMAMVWRSK